MGQIKPLPVVIVGDKEADRSPQRLQRTAETASAPRQASQIRAQGGIEALNRVGFFFCQGDEMLPPFRPNQFRIGGLPIAGGAGRGRQGIYHRLQGGKAAILAHLLAHDEAGAPIDRHPDVDRVFFCWPSGESSSRSLVSAGVWSVIWAGKALAASVIQVLTL